MVISIVINTTLCLNPVVKTEWLILHCHGLSGSVVWNLTNTNVEKLCSTAWRAGLRRVWGLPATTHNVLLPSIPCRPPLLDKIVARLISCAHMILSL